MGYKLRTHICTQCGNDRLHGAVCVMKGERGMRWICNECMEKLMNNSPADTPAAESAGEYADNPTV